MGLATPWPAMSGAEPPDGSYIPKYKGLHSSRPASPDAPSSALSSATRLVRLVARVAVARPRAYWFRIPERGTGQHAE